MVTCTDTLNALASAYIGYGSWVGLATATPGSTSTPTGEASAGSPAYARKGTTWGSASPAGVIAGSAVTIDVASGTYTYVLICSNSTGNNMKDNATITGVTMGAQGQIVVTPTYTQT